MVLSMERWKGKVAVVTGASAGIGAAIAEQLVENGVKVVGFARRVERIQLLAEKLSGKKGELHGLKVDITNTQQILDAFKTVEEKYGPVHILINNAGVAPFSTLIDGDIDKWNLIFDTNVMGLCVATREAVTCMKKNSIDGHIIHINSLSGHIVCDFPGLSVYPASKHAVTALTESLRLELNSAGSKIRVTSISPGLVSTEIADAGGWQMEPELEEMPELNAEDIADAAIYVLSTPPHVQVHELTVRPVGSLQ